MQYLIYFYDNFDFDTSLMDWSKLDSGTNFIVIRHMALIGRRNLILEIIRLGISPRAL